MNDCFVDESDAKVTSGSDPISATNILPLYIVSPDKVEFCRSILPEALALAASARNFNGETGEIVVLYTEKGRPIGILAGAGDTNSDALGAMAAGSIARGVPAGTYRIAYKPDEWPDSLTAISWGLGQYKFTRYLDEELDVSTLVLPPSYAPHEVRAIVAAINNGRDLINTPAGDMGPEQLHAETLKVAGRHGGKVTATVGDALLVENFPMLHAVGRAAHEEPRLVEFTWGKIGDPKLTLVGKGITFDTGGLNIKSAAGARIMKKDMGGAAHALTLADMVMAGKLPVRLHVLIAIAENAISAGAYRPGDILPSREGLTIEIDNTDAEGRLVLGDALCKGAESSPDLMIDFATLTGAARVALGPTLPPFFCNRSGYVEPVMECAAQVCDPMWNMPLWTPYLKMLASPIADMKNAGGSFAGSVTAALFLQRFVKDTPWMHFDVYGWNPGKTKFGQAGGEIFAVRALYEFIKAGGILAREP